MRIFPFRIELTFINILCFDLCMKTKNLSISTLLVIFCLLTAPFVAAEDSKAPAPPPNKSSADLNRIKALEGKWKSTTSMFGKENEEVFTVYKVTAGGSAVLETIMPGTPQEMVSVYYDDDKGKLAMTHYCIMQNRPHFALSKSSKDEIKLGVTKVEGLKSKNQPSMGATTIKFIDDDHFSSSCESGGKADKNHAPMTMTYTRVKD
jgi:hypothetical protein